MAEGKEVGRKSVVMVVHYYVVDQDEIRAKIQEHKERGDIKKIFSISLPGLEGATIKDAHICNLKVREDQQRFAEILYNHACAAVMGEPELIYIMHKDEK